MSKPRVKVFLYLTDFDCEPEDVTSALGIQPSQVWSRGDKFGPRMQLERKDTAWILRSPLDEPWNIQSHFRWLLDRLPDRLDCLSSVTDCWYAQMSVVAYMPGNNTPALSFDPPMVARFAQLGAALDIDLYVVPENPETSD